MINRFLPRLNLLPSLPVVVCLAIAFGMTGAWQNSLFAQGASGDMPGTPAFHEPKFRDNLYDAGGPTIYDTKNGKTVAKVIIEGNKTISDNNILSRMQTRDGRPYSADVLSRDLAVLHNTGFFVNIFPTFTEQPDGSVIIRLKFAERPTIRSVAFHGNRALDDKKLLKYCGFEVGDPISPHVTLAARNRLEDYYRSEGFNQATVTVYTGDKPDDRDIVYAISEGPLERVDDIKIIGSHDFSSELLKTKIKTKDSNRFIPGLSSYFGNKAILDTIDEDKKRLTGYYRSLGYFDARIDTQRDYDESGKWVSLNFVISEGKPYYVRNVEVEGNVYFPTEKIKPFFELKSGDPFRQVKKDADERFLRDLYGSVGFIFADIVAQVRILDDNKLDIIYSISEGDVYRISEINIHINGDKSYTKENVVRTYLGDLRPGDIANGVEIENAERRLEYSTIFEANPANGEPPRIEFRRPDELLPEEF